MRAARASGADPDDAHVGDWDLDGRPDAVLASPAQLLTVDLDEGAGISTWDLRASRVALLAAMRRRPGGLPRAAARARRRDAWPGTPVRRGRWRHRLHPRHGGGQGGGPLGLPPLRWPRAARRPRSDPRAGPRRRRRCGTAKASIDSRSTRHGRWQRLGQDRLDVRREVDGLGLERRLRIGGPRLAPWLEVEVEVDNRARDPSTPTSASSGASA